jgi:hypothetical protein
MGKEVCFSSSRSHGAWLAGAVCRGRTTRSWQELGSGDQSSECVREAQQRSVRVRAGRVYGCGVLARDRKLCTRIQGECIGCEYVHVE